VFGGIAVAGVALMVWAARMPAAVPEAPTPLRTLLGAFGDRRVAAGMWLTTLPSLMFGTVAVLGPLRLDELGAGTVAIAAAFLTGAALEAVAGPVVGRLSDRRGRLLPSMVGVAAAGVMMAALPWPSSAWVLGGLIVLAGPAIGMLYTPAMAMLSDGAESFGVAQGFAFALVNLAWGTGQAVGDAGSGRIADLAGDHVPYLILACACAATLAGLVRRRSTRPARV
jgi:MFS family permease